MMIERSTVFTCDECAGRSRCGKNGTVCSGWQYTGSTQGDYIAPEEQPVDDQANNVMVRIHWSEKRRGRVLRDTRKFVRITAPRRLQDRRNG